MRSYAAVFGLLYVCLLHGSIANPAFGLGEHIATKNKGMVYFRPKPPLKGANLGAKLPSQQVYYHGIVDPYIPVSSTGVVNPLFGYSVFKSQDSGDKSPSNGDKGSATTPANPSGGAKPNFVYPAGSPFTYGGNLPSWGGIGPNLMPWNPAGGMMPPFAAHPWGPSPGLNPFAFGRNMNLVPGNTAEKPAGGADNSNSANDAFSLGNLGGLNKYVDQFGMMTPFGSRFGGLASPFGFLGAQKGGWDHYPDAEKPLGYGGSRFGGLASPFGFLGAQKGGLDHYPDAEKPLGYDGSRFGGLASPFGFLGAQKGGLDHYPDAEKPLGYDERLTATYYPNDRTASEYSEEQSKLEVLLCILSKCWKAKPDLPDLKSDMV